MQEDLPHNVTEQCGLPLQISCFVNSDHAGKIVTQRSHTGTLKFLIILQLFGILKTEVP